jgi:hypothetical protein
VVPFGPKVAVQVTPVSAGLDVASPAISSLLVQLKTVVMLPVLSPAGQVTLVAGSGMLLSHSIIMAACIEEAVVLKLANLALCLALFKLTKTTEAKIPIIAITTKSSISVKPFLQLFFLFFFFFIIFIYII